MPIRISNNRYDNGISAGEKFPSGKYPGGVG
jgi:hypothetical protein